MTSASINIIVTTSSKHPYFIFAVKLTSDHKVILSKYITWLQGTSWARRPGWMGWMGWRLAMDLHWERFELERPVAFETNREESLTFWNKLRKTPWQFNWKTLNNNNINVYTMNPQPRNSVHNKSIQELLHVPTSTLLTWCTCVAAAPWDLGRGGSCAKQGMR